MATVIIMLGAWLCSGVIGAAIGDAKGKVWDGLFYGLLLGPLGWLIAALLPMSAKRIAKRDQEIENERRRIRTK